MKFVTFKLRELSVWCHWIHYLLHHNCLATTIGAQNRYTLVIRRGRSISISHSNKPISAIIVRGIEVHLNPKTLFARATHYGSLICRILNFNAFCYVSAMQEIHALVTHPKAAVSSSTLQVPGDLRLFTHSCEVRWPPDRPQPYNKSTTLMPHHLSTFHSSIVTVSAAWQGFVSFLSSARLQQVIWLCTNQQYWQLMDLLIHITPSY